MLIGSTSGLLPALSSQLPCRLGMLVRRQSAAAQLRKRTATSPTSGARFLTVSANGTSRVDRPSAPQIQTLPADKERLVGDLASNTRKRQKHVSCRPPNHAKRNCPAQRRRTLLWIMLVAKTSDRAWAAYEELLAHQVAIPPHLLHQLARHLGSIKPRSRTVHLRLLSVLKTLERNHGRLRLWEWNMLIDSVGKQWRKTSLEDYENALDIFNRRGVLFTGNAAAPDEAVEMSPSHSRQQNPDIWTYNTLLSIATRTNLPLAVRHASSLLLASGLTPNRYTHLCLLRYFGVRNDLSSVCSTLRKMKEQGLEVGLDGINASLWAYARNGRFDVAFAIYRLLRSHANPTPDLGEHDLGEDARYIREMVGLDVPDNLGPNEITYTMMVQAHAYHGDLRNALSIYVDMLSTPNREAVIRTDDTTILPAYYKPSMAAFRGLFLGFSRHGREVARGTTEAESVAKLFPSSQATWDHATLEAVFAAFLQLPTLPKPADRDVYWILVAFDKTSGNDLGKLREVWTKLEAKYGGGWGGRLEEIRRTIFSSEYTMTGAVTRLATSSF